MRQGLNPFRGAIAGLLMAYGAWETRYMLTIGGDWHYVPLTLAVCAGIVYLRISFLLIVVGIPQFFRYRRIKKSTGRAGTAAWAQKSDIKKAGLYKKKGFLVGMHGKRPVFVDIESSGLVLSPAGGGKTVNFVLPALCHSSLSMIVPDLKGTLACMSQDIRRKKHKNQIIKVNPAGLYSEILGESARYNPLQILIDDWNDPKLRNQLFSDAGNMARQLCPEPSGASENQYWRNGSRKFLIFAFIYLIITESHPTLSKALCLLSDEEKLIAALQEAANSSHLNGDLARLAKDFIRKLEQGDPKQVESFREGAVQSLEVFSPSGALAENTSTCDFRFHDLKTKKMTIYLIADPTRMETYAPWLGLLSFCALTELIRVQGGARVCFLCDEVTNFKIENLPSLLTLAREYKIILWLIVQELEQWSQVYGRESLETLLSQTEAKIIMGIRSHKTCQLVSDMLGEETIKSVSYNLGQTFFDPVNRSMQESARRLLTPDEVRRTEKTLLFIKHVKPILLDNIGYHEIKPWSRKIGINPLFGKKFKGKNKLRL